MRLKCNLKWCILLVMIILVSGCSGEAELQAGKSELTETEEGSEMTEGKRMTRDYAIAHGIATEEELVGVDFEAMVDRYEWVEGEEEKRDLRNSFLQMKYKFMLDGYAFDYQYLVDTEKSKNKLTDDDMNRIKTIGFECNEGTYFASMIFDLSEEKAYFGDGVDLLRKGATPTQEIGLTEEQIEEVKAHMVSSNVADWKDEYRGFNVNSTDWFWWILYYELEDGSVYAYDGNGVSGENGPENYRDFVKGLQVFFETGE